MVKKSLTYSKNKKYTGTHLIAEFWGGKIINSSKEIKEILLTATKKSKNVPHISIHTWPELDYVAIDIFSCGRKSQPYRGLEYLKKKFQPKKVRIKELKRGG